MRTAVIRHSHSSSLRSRRRLAASFQEAVIDCLVGKAELALERTGYRHALRRRRRGGQRPVSRSGWKQSAAEHGYELHIPPLALCTDNAVMGAIAVERLRAGKFEDLSLDILPGPERAAAK